jgi:serine/threonine-protein kinase RsbW/stage II sporulation protein AB (anti-sigma F factor)
VPASVSSARHAVLDHLSAAATSDPPLSDIGLAVSEAVTNAILHAYRDQDPGRVRVRVHVEVDEIQLMVEDDGGGMAPRPDSPGLGLGLPLIAQMSQRFEIRDQEGGGTRLCMWFDTAPGAATLPE